MSQDTFTLPRSNNIKKMMTEYTVVAIAFALITLFSPKNIAELGILTALPSVFLLGFVFYTKRILEGLTLSIILGYLMAYKLNFFPHLNENLTEVLTDGDTQWLFIVCGLMGSIIALIDKSGGARAFGNWAATKAKTRKSTLLWTWFLGVIIFIDDYLNSLTVGSCMAPITDKHKVSREQLAYVVDSTAAPICTLIPISTWAVFMGTLLVQAGAAAEGEGVKFFIKTIPYNFYAWIAALIVPLVIWGIIPIFGPMKKAEHRAQTTGVLAPPGSERIAMRGGKKVKDGEKKPNILNFFLPILVLIASTIYFDIDMQAGVLTTVAFTFLLYIPQGIMSPEEFFDACVEGIKHMLFPLLLVIMVFNFAAVNEDIGFLTFIIDSAKKVMTPQLFPFVIFIVFGITEFIMGMSWGMYAIAIPIVIPLSQSLGADPYIAVGAVCSAGVFGSHICFYSDATILTSSSTGCDNFQHAITQMPFGLLAAGLSALLFLAAGFWL